MLRPQAARRREDATWLDELPTERLAAMLEAGREVLEWRRILAKTGDSVVGLVLRHEAPFHVLDHYPRGDVFDPEGQAQWYYHAHDKKDRPGEHGHFHTFMRGGGMPAGIEPAPLPDFEPKSDPHLFRPQIEDLLRHRDARVRQWRMQNPGVNTYEDRRLEVTSQSPVDVQAQVRLLEERLQA
jgi:hypothetical protein